MNENDICVLISSDNSSSSHLKHVRLHKYIKQAWEPGKSFEWGQWYWISFCIIKTWRCLKPCKNLARVWFSHLCQVFKSIMRTKEWLSEWVSASVSRPKLDVKLLFEALKKLFFLREAEKTSLKCLAIKMGGGSRGPGHQGKNNFFWNLFYNVPKSQRPLSSRGGGGLGLNGPAVKRRTFFLRLPLLYSPFSVLNRNIFVTSLFV